MKTEIIFADYLKLSPEDENLVRNWPVMLRQIEERNENGFETHSVTVNGISYRGGDKKNGILMVHATVDFYRQ